MEKGNGENQSKREEIMGNRHTKNGDTEYGIWKMEYGDDEMLFVVGLQLALAFL